MKGTAFFSFILVVWFASSEVQAFNITVQEGEPISNAIYNATLHLPDFWFIFTGFNVSVTNLTCTNTTVDRIEGQIFGLIDPNPNMPFTVFLDLYIPSISLNCTANWYYKTSPITSSSGDMILSIGDNTNLAVQISAHQNISQASATPSPSPSISPTHSISISSTPTPSTTPSSPPASQTSSNTPSISITPTKSTTSTQSGSIIPTNTTTMAFAKQGVHAKEMPIQFNPNRQELEESVAQQIVQKAIFQYLEKDVNAYAKQALKVQEDDSSAPDSPPVAPHWEFESQCTMNATITYLHTSSFTLNTLIPQIIDAVEPLIPGLVCDQVHDIVTTEIETAGNAVIQQLYNEAYILNSGNPGFVFNKDAFLYAFLGAGILFFLMFFFLLVIPTMIEIYNEHKRAVQGEFQSLIVNQPSTHSMDSVVLPAENTSAMIMDKRLAWYWRYALLFVVLYNVALFATSTVSVASNVYLYITVGTKIIRLPSLYSFMIVTSVVEMWNAGVWPLSLLIAVASGIWPYVKLVIMFFLMLIPPKYLSPKWRKRILRVLDALGKWSLIDVYVLVLFINAFRIHIPLGDNVAIDMAVEPQYAFFAYLLATVTSLILTHVFLYVHDELEEPAIPENGKMEQLYNHRFHYGSRRFVLTIFGKILVPIVIIIAAVGVISGSSVYAFEFDWSGSLAGSALVATGQDITKNFSVFSLLLDIPGTAYNQQSGAGVRTVQCTYALFVLAIPLLHLAALFVVWVTPLTMQMQRGFYILIEVLSAWAAMDVFIVALIVALLELQQFADYLIDGKCNGIEYLLSLVPGAPQTCFTVKASLKSGSWILVLAVIVLLVVGYSVMYICNKAIRERKDKEIKHLQKMGSMSDFYAPDRSISIVTKGIVHTFKAIMCIRFL